MSQEIREYVATIPAGTPIATPVTIDIEFPARSVQQIDVRVPPGPKGCMGFQLGTGGMPVIPANLGQWIVADDEVFHWPLEGYWDSGSWDVFGYNTGTFPHSIYLTFQLNPITQPSTAPAPISGSDLSNLPPAPAAPAAPNPVGGA